MHATWLRYFLIVYVSLYTGVCFFLRSWIVWKKTGINPIVFGKSDNVHDYVGKWFRNISFLNSVPILVYSFFNDYYKYLVPIHYLERFEIQTIGIVLLLFSFFWVAIAQHQMRESWRVGIDQTHKTKLTQQGLYLFSRNPIYLGISITFLGFFLVIPNALSLVTMVLAGILIQIQVRLEEEHLSRLHSKAFVEYCRRVRRWF